jgi:hypothetical protein
MTRTVRSEEQVQAMKPDYVAPLIAVLCSDKCPTPTGKLYESGSGWFAETRWQRTRGVDFPHDKGVPSAEAVLEVTRFPSASQFDTSLTAKKRPSMKSVTSTTVWQITLRVLQMEVNIVWVMS